MKVVLYICLGVLVGVIGTAAAWQWLFGPRHYSAEELLQTALNRDLPTKQEEAAVKLAALAARNPGHGEDNKLGLLLLRVLRESGDPRARVAAARGLAVIGDCECGPDLLDMLDDPSAPVREATAQALRKLMTSRFEFHAQGTSAVRAEEIKKIRDTWDKFDAWRKEATERQKHEDDEIAAEAAKKKQEKK